MVQALSAFPKATLLRGHKLSHESSSASPAPSCYTSFLPKTKKAHKPEFCYDIARGHDLPQPRDLTHARLQRVTICTEPVFFLEAPKETRTVGSTDFSGSILSETKNITAYSLVIQLCVEKKVSTFWVWKSLLFTFFILPPFWFIEKSPFAKSKSSRPEESRHCMDGPSAEHRLFHFIDFHLYGDWSLVLGESTSSKKASLDVSSLRDGEVTASLGSLFQ